MNDPNKMGELSLSLDKKSSGHGRLFCSPVARKRRRHLQIVFIAKKGDPFSSPIWRAHRRRLSDNPFLNCLWELPIELNVEAREKYARVGCCVRPLKAGGGHAKWGLPRN